MESTTILVAKGNDRPALRDLNNFVVPYIGPKWYALGFQLLDEQYGETLQSLKNNNKNVEDCCMEMLQEWLRTEPQNATWARLIESLQTPSVKLNRLANRLQQLLLPKPKHGPVTRFKNMFMSQKKRNYSASTIKEEHEEGYSGTPYELEQIVGSATFPDHGRYGDLRRTFSTQTVNTLPIYNQTIMQTEAPIPKPRLKKTLSPQYPDYGQSSTENSDTEFDDANLKQLQTELEKMQKQFEVHIKKVQSDFQALAEKHDGLESTIKQLQEDLKNTKYEIESQKQNKPDNGEKQEPKQNVIMRKDDIKPTEYRKQLNRNQSQSDKEDEIKSSISKALAEKEKQSLEQKVQVLVHEKQDIEQRFDATKATYIKQIEDLNEQLKRKEMISSTKLQSAESEQVTELQSALNRSENQNKALLQEKKEFESSMQKTLHQHKQKLNLLEQTNTEVTNKLKQKDNEIIQQNHEIDALKRELEKAKEDREELKQELEQMKKTKEGSIPLEHAKNKSDMYVSKTLQSTDHNQNEKKSLQSVKVDQVPKMQELISIPLKDLPSLISSNTETSSKPVENQAGHKENTVDSTADIATPFGARKMSISKKTEPDHVEPAVSGVVDSQLQKLFAKRAEKNKDETSLKTFEETVQERMKYNRASVKQTVDQKYHKENVGDRGVDSELLAKLNRRKSKI